MKKQLIALLVLASYSSVSIFAQKYNEDDKEGLRQFFRQPSSNEQALNFEVLGLDVSDTLNWHQSEEWLKKLPENKFGWIEDKNSLKRLHGIDLSKNTKVIDPNQEATKYELGGILDCSRFSMLAELNGSHNQIMDIDVSKNIHLTSLNISYNQLEELEISNNINLKELNYNYNNFTFSTLPEIPRDIELNISRSAGPKRLTSAFGTSNSAMPKVPKDISYTPQNVINGGNIPYNYIDLSKEYIVKGEITEYKWYEENGKAITIKNKGKGIFVAKEKHSGKTLICKMTNKAYPGMTVSYKMKAVD